MDLVKKFRRIAKMTRRVSRNNQRESTRSAKELNWSRLEEICISGKMVEPTPLNNLILRSPDYRAFKNTVEEP
jgi:hypothetical protein